jgi:hypothetical protein
MEHFPAKWMPVRRKEMRPMHQSRHEPLRQKRVMLSGTKITADAFPVATCRPGIGPVLAGFSLTAAGFPRRFGAAR